MTARHSCVSQMDRGLQREKKKETTPPSPHPPILPRRKFLRTPSAGRRRRRLGRGPPRAVGAARGGPRRLGKANDSEISATTSSGGIRSFLIDRAGGGGGGGGRIGPPGNTQPTNTLTHTHIEGNERNRNSRAIDKRLAGWEK